MCWRCRYFIVGLIASMVVTGCAPNIVVTPDVAPVSSVHRNDLTISGQIDYDGNRDYLPRTISPRPDPDSHLTVRYRYSVTYGRDAMHQAIPLFNPLTIVGFPIGADTVVVTAKLEILKQDSPLKTYSSTCALDKHRTIFWEGENMSELRKRGLLAVRDNIELQMYRDADELTKACRGTESNSQRR